MYTNEELSSLYEFLSHTPEGGLKKMLVEGNFTEAHLRILLKLAKGGGDQATFIDSFEKEDLGKIKLSPKESPLKGQFWKICIERLSTVGLIGKPKAA